MVQIKPGPKTSKNDPSSALIIQFPTWIRAKYTAGSQYVEREHLVDEQKGFTTEASPSHHILIN